MTTNTADILSRGMKILSDNMGIIEAERFIFLVKAENFNYTEWQRDYFDSIPPEKLEADMAGYFQANPYRGNAEIL